MEAPELERRLAAKLYAEKRHTISEISRMLGVARASVYRYIAPDRADAPPLTRR